MSVLGYGKVGEGIKVSAGLVNGVARQITGSTNTVYFNGYSPTTGAVMFDTQDYDDLGVSLLIGTVLGAGVTVTNALFESATNDPMTATAISGADFTAVTSASTAAAQIANVHCADTKRYICIRTTANTHTAIPYTFPMSAVFLGGQAKSQSVTNTLVFDL